MKTKEVRKRLKKLNKKWGLDFVDAMKADGITGYFSYGGEKKNYKRNLAFEESQTHLYAKVDEKIWIYYDAPFSLIRKVCKDLQKEFSDELIVEVPTNEYIAIELRPKK